ncbi:Nucleotide-binding universal stress protein, UspA family [Muriicola jejuensis]|uniref:Universal stress protein n=1 Tax=Muriicola jejuensis TaxID=504488 RepID=A0A6P0UC83_9FLAO|nr:universal stress protein [Muriicola jejuensis]NER10875.1 universal stress protein [Muriicola jejuensis]SMP15881.1 Nucleotide-binding universal stress protein, UspA family [Muriicola jejuensis]
MKRILLPTDFSPTARNAIEYALAMFEKESCTFYLLHTYTPAIYRVDYLLGGAAISALPDAEVGRSAEGLDKTLSEMKKMSKNPEHRFEIVSAFNILSHEINELTESKKIDLVIMGTKGATGAKEVFIGSNTVYVLRKASIPVLVVPDKVAYSPIKEILFPTNYLSRYKKFEIQHILNLATSEDAMVTVLHVKETPELSEEQLANKAYLDKLLENTAHTFIELQDTRMPYAVIEYLEKESFDLLAMMNKKHNLLEQIFSKQNVDHVGYHIKIPFLSVRDTSEFGSREEWSEFGLNWGDLSELQKR